MYRIGELAKACGVKADTLRFYEKNGLISPGIRNQSGYRLYSEQDRRRLEFIIRAKSVGFSLADIGELLDLERHHRRRLPGAGVEPREILLDQAAGLPWIEVADEDPDEVAGP